MTNTLGKRLAKLEQGKDDSGARVFLQGLLTIESGGEEIEQHDLAAYCYRRDLAAGRTTAPTVNKYLHDRLAAISAADGQERYRLFTASINSLVKVQGGDDGES